MTLKEMQEHYPTQQHCCDLLEELVWNYIPKCPHCHSDVVVGNYRSMYDSKIGHRCGDCRLIYSVTKSTIMHNTRIPLVKWFTAIHTIKTLNRKPESTLLSRKLGISPQSALEIRAKILDDLKSDDSLCEQIYQNNRQLETVW